MAAPNRTRVGLFLGLLGSCAAGVQIVSTLTTVSAISLAPIYMFTPLVAGMIVCLVHDISLGQVGLRPGRIRWIVASGLVALPLVGLTLLFALVLPDVGFDPAADPVPGLELPSGIAGVGIVFALVLVTGMTVNALFAFGEEFGWRGYFLWELAPLGFWPTSLLIGATWGLWHAPIILEGYNFPAYPVLGVAVMTLACIAFSPVYTYLVLRAESVVAAAFLHGVFNGSAGLVVVYASTSSTALDNLGANAVGGAGILAFAVAGLAIAIVGTPTLSRTAVEAGS